jgi:glycosyltransferase involved in cell wall biosynthesis
LHILLVTSRYPWPPRRGDQVRSGQMLSLLAPEHRVTLLTPAPAPGQPAPPRLDGVEVVTYVARTAVSGVVRAAARGLPLQSGLFYAPDLRRELRRRASGADLVILQLVRLALHRDDLGATPVLVDLIDDLALNFRRRAAVDSVWLRPALLLEARLLARAQRRLAAGAAGVLVAAERDRRELLRLLPDAAARRVATVGLVAGGLEPGDGASAAAAGVAGGANGGANGGAPRLVFTGNLGYFVNVDAVCWWLREVWPRLVARRPGLRLAVAGERPAAAVRRAVAAAARLAGPRGNVALIPAAPDLGAVLAGSTVALAPMRCGSGVPVKVLEAWAAGVPVVASRWAAAGTSGAPGEDLLVAGSPDEWVEALEGLLDDAAARRRLAAAGRRRLQADYSRERIRRDLLAAVAAAAG